MGLCVAVIGHPIDGTKASKWASPDQMECVLATAELQNVNVVGLFITGDKLCFENIDCNDVAGVILYECNDSDKDQTRVYDIPLTMAWEQTDEGWCLYPCFEDGCDDVKDEQTEPDYMAFLCEDPCQRWARLHYQKEELMYGQQLASASRSSKTKQFNVNFAEQMKQLTIEIRKAKAECHRCNPCFKPEKRSTPLFHSVGK